MKRSKPHPKSSRGAPPLPLRRVSSCLEGSVDVFPLWCEGYARNAQPVLVKLPCSVYPHGNPLLGGRIGSSIFPKSGDARGRGGTITYPIYISKARTTPPHYIYCRRAAIRIRAAFRDSCIASCHNLSRSLISCYSCSRRSCFCVAFLARRRSAPALWYHIKRLAPLRY